MKIVVLGYDHPVDDKRVWRTVRALAKKHEVVYIYRFDDSRIEIEEKLKRAYPNVKFEPVVLEARSLKGLYSFDKENVECVIESGADIWYLHTAPDTQPLTLFKEAKRKGIRLIYDSHELYPYAQFSRLVKRSKPKDLVRRLLTWHIFAMQIEYSDAVILASYAVKRYVQKVLGNMDHLYVIPNIGEKIDFGNVIKDIEKQEKVVFVGLHWRPIPLDFIYVLHYEFGFAFEYVSSEPVEELNKYSWVIWHSPMHRSEILGLLATAKWSIILYDLPVYEKMNYALSVPNKLFDSISVFTPVLVRRHLIETSLWVDKFGVGLVIDDLADMRRKLEDVDYASIVGNIKKHYDKFVWGERWDKRIEGIVLGNCCV